MLVRATWQRHLPGVGISAFLDRSYLVDFGFAENKPPALTVGWYRWHPDFVELNRTRRGPWHFSESKRFRRMSHLFQAAARLRELTPLEQARVDE
jgi:hypothetical protein